MISEIFEFLGSLHPLVVHLPIGFILLTFLVDLSIKAKNNTLQRVVTLGWFFSFFSGVIAALFGWFLADNNYYFKSEIDIHKWTAFAFIGVSFLVWIVRFLNFKLSKTLKRLINTTVLILILITGHYGGEMTHGTGYLLKNIPFIEKNDYKTNLLTDSDKSIDSLFIYENMIYPVIEEKCIVCHNNKNSFGGLNMNSYENILKGGNSGKGIVKGNPYKSLIFNRVSLSQSHPKFMPPTGIPMSYDQIAVLHWWIDNGANTRMPLTKFRKNISILKLVEEQHQLDLKEKSYLQTLNIPPLTSEKLSFLNNKNFQWRFLTGNNIFLDIKFIGKKISYKDIRILMEVKKNITWLNLSNCLLTDALLTNIGEFENLTRLKIHNNILSDKGISSLIDLRNLSELNIYNTKITDKSFNVFSKMTGLKKIFVWNSNVSLNGINAFKSKNPEIEVISGI